MIRKLTVILAITFMALAYGGAKAQQPPGGSGGGGGGGGLTTLSDLGCGPNEIARVNAADEWECSPALTTLEGQNLDPRLSTIEGQDLDSRVTTVEGKVSTIEGQNLDPRLTFVEEAVLALQTAITDGLAALQTQINGLLVRVGALEEPPVPSIKTVNCPTDSLQEALDTAVEGDTFNVTGTCSELEGRYTITTDNVTIDGQGTVIDLVNAVVTNGAILNGRIRVRADRVVIRDLTLIGLDGATSSGIIVNFNASATIRGSVIKDAGNSGISINQGGYAQIGSARREHIEVGEPASQGNLIQNSSSGGVSIRLGGAADVAHNVITGNGGNGISVIMGAVADIAANIISSNDWGISVSTGGVVATDDSGHSVGGSRETNTISNHDRGINCSSGGILTARVLPNYVSDTNTDNLRASTSCEVDSDLGPISM